MTLTGHCAVRDDAGRWRAAPGRLSLSGGRIGALTPDADADDAGSLILPALSNAHDHGRGMRTVAFGAGDDALEIWIAALGREPRTDPWLRAAVAFARMAEAGIAALNHCHNTADPHALLTEAEAVSRAARDVGVRVAFALPIMGRNPLTYGDPAPLLARLPADEAARLSKPRGLPSAMAQLALVEEAAAFEHDLFEVQYGPVGPQWVDDTILERIAEGSARTGRRVHMHLFETRYQKEWAEAAYPGGLLAHLDAIGLLSERLTVAHGVHLDEDDCALLAERGVRVSLNTSSNLRLRSGIAPVERYLRHGLRFGLGLDGMAFDDDEDALRELRVAWRLQRGWGTQEVLARDRLLDAALIDGRRAILGDKDRGGQLVPGAPADVLVLDTGRITGDVLEGCADLLDLTLARARAEDVRSLLVAGRAVVADGRATGIDRPAAEAELMAQARAAGAIPPDAALERLRAALAVYYRCGCHRQIAPEEQTA
ncbi:amidohydrolase family protein [Roseibacterium sp. SDUM158016]|uniref:amidohydrolase family protein n=1 Tax=Roseicyclus sediminis TaxID=2980997 RepID=UPI0021CE4DE3|nr:amidohydrolase family protein [Roseibacterium sp. SDUM158016]MCU4651795.1 amidohydrolase family protein [Roseibacterium sp. SDUM158016]